MQEKVVLTCLLAIPVAPRDEKASRQLKKLYGPKEKEAFSVSPELKDPKRSMSFLTLLKKRSRTVRGLLLGFGYNNPTLRQKGLVVNLVSRTGNKLSTFSPLTSVDYLSNDR